MKGFSINLPCAEIAHLPGAGKCIPLRKHP